MSRVAIEIVADGLAQDVLVPVLVARGRRPGPVFGLTAGVHGNELNGLRVIHDLFRRLDVAAVRGVIVGVVAVNVPALHLHQREFPDGTDLNRIFPGRRQGNIAEVYAYRLIDRIISRFDYLVDLHTASFGRINSLYVRADMRNEQCARMAYRLRPQIIVHNQPNDRSLRGTAMKLGIPAVTLEIGDPQRFQSDLIRFSGVGIRNLLGHAGILPRRSFVMGPEPVLCTRSFWLYTDRGGLLEVIPRPTDRVDRGATIAHVRNAYGDLIRSYAAPLGGIVVGKSVNPVGQTGARILHLGVMAERDHDLLRREPHRHEG